VGLVEGDGVEVKAGEIVTVTHSHERSKKGFIATEYEHIASDLRAGEHVLIDDGRIRLQVVSKGKGVVRCRVISGGLVKEHKGINLPGTIVSAPSLTAKDRVDLEFGLKLGVDYVALSFVRRAQDVEELKKIIARRGSPAKVISKIEKPEALRCIEAVVRASDAIMVARGDLGVEMPVETVPVEQKRLVALSNMMKKPVIVATQMLESMVESPMPTRAEASDVANAVYDGTDAVMLSAESASGAHPFEAVAVMSRIIAAAERSHELDQHLGVSEARRKHAEAQIDISDAVADSVCHAAKDVGAKIIVVFTQSGGTALYLSKYRPRIPIVAFTPEERVCSQMALMWGVKPELMPFRHNTDELIESAVSWLLSSGSVRRGDIVAVVAGMPIAGRGKTNFMKLHRV
ncbi:MAG: pyruvate kinase, partial [Myxococcota bacterium]|jgi:pyruvate kinase